MKRTVESSVRRLLPRADDSDAVGLWMGEVVACAREMRDALNVPYFSQFPYTTNSTAAFETAWTSDSLPTTGAWEVNVLALALCTADGSAARYYTGGLFKRFGGGSASQVGATANLISAIEDVAGWDVQFTTSGNTVVYQVKGDATRVVKWLVMPVIRELV